MERFLTRIFETPLSVDDAYRFVTGEPYGAVVIFLGTVRNENEGKRVQAIHYSAFKEMAEKEFAQIAESAARQWNIGKVALLHRVGKLGVNEISVIVAVSAPHRNEAFEASRFAIEKLKKLAPIWKEEFYEHGKAWVV